MYKVRSGISGSNKDDIISNNSYMTKGGDNNNDVFADIQSKAD